MSKHKKNTTTSTYPTQFMPIVNQGVRALQGAYNSQGGVQKAVQTNLGGLFDRVNSMSRNPLGSTTAAQGLVSRTAQGGFLNSNPYIDALVGDVSDDITDAVGSTFEGAGRYGSGMHQGTLAREVGRAATGIRGSNYEAERERMMQAAGMAPGLEAARYLGVNPLLQLGQGVLGAGFHGANQLAGGIAGLLGGTNQTTTRQSDGGSGALGTALTVASTVLPFLSDRRAKENVEKIGKLDSGLNVYKYNYKGNPQPQIGVMAQEVAKKKPEALGPQVQGLLTVNYGAL